MTTQVPTPEAAARSRLLKTWSDAYYKGTPIVDDEVYDYHEKKQKEEWPEDPFLGQVGGVFESTLEQATEGEAMLSLKKTYSPHELKKFIAGRAVTVELKIDGGSLELRYRNGILSQAVTRGRNGELGSDVTVNALHIQGIPHVIDRFNGEIRGEAVQSFKAFEEYNKKCAANGKEPLKHPRNAANGALQNSNPQAVIDRGIQFIAYIIVGQEEEFPSEEKVLYWLKDKGFTLTKATYYKQAVTFTHQIEAQLSKWEKRMKEAPYPCDGIVIQLADRALRKSLGCASNHPRGGIAFKWEAENAEVALQDIEWTTGRLGDVDPVGIIEPTHLSGAEITRVTLHHVGYVRQHNIKPGATIKIIRSGEIIPKHLETVEVPDDATFNIPTKCPSCGTDLVEEEGQTLGAATLLCGNILCPAQQFHRILHYVQTAGIDHLGEGILKALFDQGYVKNIPDLYLLPGKSIEAVAIKGKTLGTRRAKKININIEKASVLPIYLFVASLGIRGLGRGTCKKLFERFDTVEELLTVGPQDLLRVEGFATTKAQIAHRGLQANKDLIMQMLPLVKFKQEEQLTLPSVLSGLRFVVTGSFSEDMPRKEIEKMIKAAGGQLQSSPNKFTSYLVKGEGGGSKAVKAAKFGTPTIGEQGFLDLFAERSESLENKDDTEDE